MVTILDQHWPLVIALVDDEITLADIAAMHTRYDSLHARDQRFVLFQETRTARPPGALIRQELARLNDAFLERTRRQVPWVGVVASGVLATGALRAIFWLSREATPLSVESTATALWPSLVASCATHRLSLPSAVRPFLAMLDVEIAAGHGLAHLR